jgi:hypothetical protein
MHSIAVEECDHAVVANFKLLSKHFIAGVVGKASVSATGSQPRFEPDTFLFIYLFMVYLTTLSVAQINCVA